MLDLGAGERLLHLAGIAAGDVEEGERQRDGLERVVKHRPYLLVGKCVGIDELLVGRPLLLELFERGLVGNAGRLDAVKMDVHEPLRPPFAG
jgi:hypothetical protein